MAQENHAQAARVLKHPVILGKIQAAVVALNTKYGSGDVQSVQVFQDGRIEFIVKGEDSTRQSRRGQLVGGRTVKVLGRQAAIENPQGLGALRPSVQTAGLTRETLLNIWVKTQSSARSPYMLDGCPPMWSTRDCGEGFVLFARPARVLDRPAPYMPYVEVDGLAYQFQLDGKWVGQGSKVPFEYFLSKGACLTY